MSIDVEAQKAFDKKIAEIQEKIRKTDWEVRFMYLLMFLVGLGFTILTNNMGFLYVFFAFVIVGIIMRFVQRAIA